MSEAENTSNNNKSKSASSASSTAALMLLENDCNAAIAAKLKQQAKLIASPTTKNMLMQQMTSDTEEGFLSTSPDSANGEFVKPKEQCCSGAAITTATTTTTAAAAPLLPVQIFNCTDSNQCANMLKILEKFKISISEEQAWALIYQFASLTHKSITATAPQNSSNDQRFLLTTFSFMDLDLPLSFENLSLHRDGSVHWSWTNKQAKLHKNSTQQQQLQQNNALNQQQKQEQYEQSAKQQQQLEQQKQAEQQQQQLRHDYGNRTHLISLQRKCLHHIAILVFNALDYNMPESEQSQISPELEELINYMVMEDSDDDCIDDDEGIDEGDKRWDDEGDDYKLTKEDTKDFDFVLEACKKHTNFTVPEEHYKAVCRALVTEFFDFRAFLLTVGVYKDIGGHGTSQSSKKELAKLDFHEWACLWVQVIDELRVGVSLKKSNYTRERIEYELTPYEILMDDIRSKKYRLRKVMINGDIPPRIKKDAHAIILDFIRSRPPLKKASERQLPPPKQRTQTPREELMDSIRKGQTLKHIQPPKQTRLKDRLLPTNCTSTPTAAVTSNAATIQQHTLEWLKLHDADFNEAHTTRRSKQRLIKVDHSLLQDDDNFFDEAALNQLSTTGTLPAAKTKPTRMGVCSQPKMPPYPIGGYVACTGNTTTTTAATTAQAPITHMQQQPTPRALRRITYDLATQCESRRSSQRRHTIVGCQSNFLNETNSIPTTHPESRQTDVNTQKNNNNSVSTTKQLHNHLNCEKQQQMNRSQSPAAISGVLNNADDDAAANSDDAAKEQHEKDSNCSRSSSSIGGPWNKSFLDEKTWNERGDDRLSLTLEEIVHIRSVMTKAELEGLPVGVRVKEDVEKRKVCFLCLRTRFSMFGPWGIQCKLCQRTVCSKCYTKMRIPSEHFRNVPLVLISPSLLASPAGSSTPSPSHHAAQQHAHSASSGNILDDTFPKSLIERLLRSESERKTRNSVGSAPSSPKHQRSNMSTPGITMTMSSNAAAAHAVEALHDENNDDVVHHDARMTTSYTAGSSNISSSSNYSAQQQHQQQQQSSYGLSSSSIYANGLATAHNKNITNIMSRSMEGQRSLPVSQWSPARTYSNSSTLDRKSKLARTFTLSGSGTHLSQDQKENMRGEQVPVCNDCKGLVMEITRSSKQTRSSARNRALKNLTLDLSPVYK